MSLCQNRFHHWFLFVVTTLCLQCDVVVSWVTVIPNTPNSIPKFHRGLKLQRYMSSSSLSSSPLVGTSIDTNNNNSAMESMNKNTTSTDNDDDWEYIEFDSLTESDLVGSEWLVGTCWDNRPNVIDETWCRLGRGKEEKDKNIAIWGDNSQGTWALDVATQYLTISKVQPWGKQIWACLVEDYYYLRGTVRGWTYWTAASVEAQWQARRLNVDPEEAGIAPWFDEPSDEKEEEA